MATQKDRDAKRIAALMAASGIAPEELAKRMRVDRSTVYHWRNGARFPSRGMQPKLAKQLGCTVAELNGWAA